MKPRNLTRLLLAATLVASASTAQAASAGHIPNDLVDRLIVAPLKASDSIWDVFQVINGWLSEVYPQEGDSRVAIDAFSKFIKEFNTEEGKNIVVPRTVEMPLSVDAYLRILRKEAPGVGGTPLPAALQGNPKAQLYTAVLLPFVQMRGIAYRLRPLVARSYLLHNTVVNGLRVAKQSMEVRSGKNGLAVFEFLTYPMAGRKREQVQFHKFSEVQDWVRTQLVPTFDVAIALAENALREMKPGEKMSVDLSTFLQADNPFPDEAFEMGNRTFGAPEVNALLARMYFNRARLQLFQAYDMDDFPAVSNKLRDVYLKAFFKEKVSFSKKPRVGSPPVVRFRVTKQFPNFLTVKDSSRGPLALADLRKAWKHYDTAMEAWYASPGDDNAHVFDVAWLHATHPQYRNKIAPQIDAVLAGPASLTDYVGGSTVDFDLTAFFKSMPSDLKDFFPVAFHEEHPYWEFEFSSGDLSYTNYDFGTGAGWDLTKAKDTWAKIFPTMSLKPDKAGNWSAPMVTYRDFARTYVGRMLASFLSPALF